MPLNMHPQPSRPKLSPPELSPPESRPHQIMEWLDVLVRALVRTTLICFGLYGLYTLKSALGIDLSKHYHAIDIFQTPVDVIIDILRV